MTCMTSPTIQKLRCFLTLMTMFSSEKSDNSWKTIVFIWLVSLIIQITSLTSFPRKVFLKIAPSEKGSTHRCNIEESSSWHDSMSKIEHIYMAEFLKIASRLSNKIPAKFLGKTVINMAMSYWECYLSCVLLKGDVCTSSSHCKWVERSKQS